MDSLSQWSLVAGLLLLSLVLTGTWTGRLPLSSAMIYLACGAVLGPGVLDFLSPDPLRDAAALELVCELALLISLFAVGLQLGVPILDRRWTVPVVLAFASMAATVAMVGTVGFVWLGLPLGAAVLLGAILAPTDPVLASGVQAEAGPKPDRVGFSLAAEGGLNDGAAFPFVMLGLGLLGHRELGSGLLRWGLVDLAWATLGGIAIGAVIGAATGYLIVYLRSRHRQAVGLDMFLGLGLIALAYGLAHLLSASGFLAVFATGLSLRRVAELPSGRSRPLGGAESAAGHAYSALATHSHHASATMRDSVQLFNGQLEKLAELVLVVLVGAMLVRVPLPEAGWWFVPLMLLVVRPLSVLPALIGQRLTCPQAGLLAWFGIRGIGSVYYLALVLQRDLGHATGQWLASLTLWTVAASIVLHGLTARPLMRRHRGRRRAAPSSQESP